MVLDKTTRYFPLKWRYCSIALSTASSASVFPAVRGCLLDDVSPLRHLAPFPVSAGVFHRATPDAVRTRPIRRLHGRVSFRRANETDPGGGLPACAEALLGRTSLSARVGVILATVQKSLASRSPPCLHGGVSISCAIVTGYTLSSPHPRGFFPANRDDRPR